MFQTGFSLKAEWLEHLIPVLEVMDSDPTVSGVISGKLKLAAGFIQSTLWRGLIQCLISTEVIIVNVVIEVIEIKTSLT